ncbi:MULTISPECIES: hypothetical protein [Kamptonema]|uniref:hypothetical protein n=1 Tax=Kamptonema TaxID=1501433 RepID=UPI0001DACAA8|nr:MULTISPECIES: hypothetical protein [Kamptonema]CBN55590.1 hypothetical protein OSCI_2140005 [Kamptonema sp. PCC 6506]
MKIRESVGQSVWNSALGWCCEPLDPIPPGYIALAIEAMDLDLVDWDIEEIGEKVGFNIEYRYTGVNDPKDSSLACVSQFVGIYEDWSKLHRDLEALIAAGIPRHLFKILTSNDDIDLKPVTEYAKATLV